MPSHKMMTFCFADECEGGRNSATISFLNLVLNINFCPFTQNVSGKASANVFCTGHDFTGSCTRPFHSPPLPVQNLTAECTVAPI